MVQDFVDALWPTPFDGCKGESLVTSEPSGFQVPVPRLQAHSSMHSQDGSGGRIIDVTSNARRYATRYQSCAPLMVILLLTGLDANRQRYGMCMQARKAAYRRTMLAGRVWWDRAWTLVKVELHEMGTWLLCVLMYLAEAFALGGWLQSARLQDNAKHASSDVSMQLEP